MNYEVVNVKIEKLETLADNSKVYSVLADSVDAILIPVDETKLALYPDLPIGRSFNCLVSKNLEIKAGYRFTVLDAYISQFKTGDVFYAYGDFNKVKFLHKIVSSGLVFQE